ncbi:substrate-binding domain-containing protein [Aquipuribacter nitratireducens]|uniref:Substrate-binding domain-containing protein n=1 Tax=Aquipuribacter nitratireducens TaxID=650104 RepID=A0ABW0GGX7_9MICO
MDRIDSIVRQTGADANPSRRAAARPSGRKEPTIDRPSRPARPRRPTLQDVAAAAGVSASTASLAFSGAGPVAEATRRRVLDAAQSLGYAGPDPTAASLRRGRSGVVGVVVGERIRDAFRDPYVATLLDGLVDALAGEGLAILLLPMVHDVGGQPAEQYRTAPMDAVVYATGGLPDDPSLPVVLGRGVPVVAIEGPEAPGASLVRIDDRDGSRHAARLLAGLGHARVGVVTMPWRLDGSSGALTASRRALAGFADSTARLAGVEDVLAPVAVVECPTNTVEAGRDAAVRLLGDDVGERPTAVVAQSDVLAAGVVQGCRDLGLDVPGDVSVVGFDGVEIPWLPLQLTTLVQPVTEKARATADAVLARLAGGPASDVTLPVRLRVGATTGPPPG